MGEDANRRSDRSSVYARYLPDLIVQKLAEVDQHKPSADKLTCAVMFADISGFTALTERLTHQEGSGAERLTRILNAYFTPLIDMVTGHGGDVLKFAGDALIAIWPQRHPSDSQADLAFRASYCGLEIQRELSNYEIEGASLALRVCVGTGELLVAHLGGELNRWEFIISGKPLDQVGQVSDEIAPGGVGICPATVDLLATVASAEPVLKPLPQIGAELVELAAKPVLPTGFSLTPAANNLEQLQRYIPGAILHRLIAGQDEYLAELRRLTVLFVNLPELHYSASLDQAQQVMVTLQQCCYAFEGSINKLSVDDKGVSLLAAFGLPPLAHSDDPERGIRCALKMRQALTALGWNCSIGVTTGRVYCGEVGSEHRREYTIMGDPVNLAARLMQKAQGNILCDQATSSACSPQIAFDQPFGVALKGKTELVTVSRPISASNLPVQAVAEQTAIGREQEIALLNNQLNKLTNHQQGSICLVQAPSGMGKTLLLKTVQQQAERMPLLGLVGHGDSVESQSPYFAWQQMLAPLFAEPRGSDRLLDALKQSRQANNMALLNDLLPLAIETNRFTDNLSGEVRSEKLRELILALLELAADGKPLLIVIDDGHWMDSASWGLLRWVYDRHRALMLVLATRPGPKPSANMAEALELADEIIDLAPLSASQTSQLLGNVLGVSQVPTAAVDLIVERTEGHPYFSEQMAYALRDAGMLMVTEQGQCVLADEFGPAMDLPHSIEGVITARLDRLSPQQGLTAKVASIAGRQFSQAMIAGIYPGTESAQTVGEHLEHLTELEMTQCELPLSSGQYAFRQIMTQQVAYDLMPDDLKSQLHGKLARWLENHHQDLRHHYGLLAYHWERAGDHPQSLKYLEWAATEAQETFANTEAEQLLKRALNLAEKTPTSNVRVGSWLRRLGTVQRDMGRLEEARQTLESALQTLGFPIPAGKPAMTASMLVAAARQLWRSYRPPPTIAAMDQRESLRALEAAECHELLNIIYYWGGDTVRMLLACLRGANLAGYGGGKPRVLTRLYANLGLITSVIPLRRAPHYYCVIAERQAREDSHPPTLSWVLLLTGTHCTGIGRWEQAQAHYDEGRTLAQAIGDDRHWSALTASLNIVHLLRGQHQLALTEYEALAQVGEKSSDRQTMAWASGGKARVYFRIGQIQKMQHHTQLAHQMIDACTVANQLDIISQLALLALHDNDDAAALGHLKHCVTLLHRPTQVTLYAPSIQLAFAAMEYLRRHDGAAAQEIARSALRFSRGFARIFVVGGPAFSVVEGLHQHALGKSDAAIICWRRALGQAMDLSMPYEQALAGHGLTACGVSTDTERRQFDQALKAMGIDQVGFPYLIKPQGHLS